MSDMSPADALLRSAVKRGVDLPPLRVNADASGGDPAPNVAEGGSGGEEEVELKPVDSAAPKTPPPPKWVPYIHSTGMYGYFAIMPDGRRYHWDEK